MTARTPEELLPRIVAAINTGDPDEVLKYWDEEGCFALADGTRVRGHAELLAAYEQRLGLGPEMQEHAISILETGGIALVAAEWSTYLRDGEIDGQRSFEGTATLVLRRHADGGWRVLLDNVA